LFGHFSEPASFVFFTGIKFAPSLGKVLECIPQGYGPVCELIQLGATMFPLFSPMAGAADRNMNVTKDASRYSDRDRMRSSKDKEDRLEKALKTGEEKDFYRREQEKMGWQITSVNYDKPDYVEYEIVKGDDSYEVQIDLDTNSHKAKKVDVAFNAWWKTDATKRALNQRQSKR
jgi:hypothetical protein